MSTRRTTRRGECASMKYHKAIQQALRTELATDPSVFIMGEDVGLPGGIYAQTRGLQEEFGAERVRDTPAGELGFMGAAVGCAMTGMRPIVEISFADFLPICIDQLVNQAAKIRYMSGGQVNLPLTVLSFSGAGRNAGPQHSGTYDAWLGSVPGLKVVAPSTPLDVAGLIRGAVRDDDPVVVLMHKALLGTTDDAEDAPAPMPLGEAAVRRAGDDVTIVAWSAMTHVALAAAETLAAENVSAEVIDLRSIQPLDSATVVESVIKTHRAVVVTETPHFAGIASQLVAEIVSGAFGWLDAPVGVVAPPFTPVPFAPALESFYLPTADDVVRAVREIL